jgi:tRNA (cytidine32/uridine32-2'-O)-methyltransferase
MKNMGLRHLRLVEPPALDVAEARNLAYGAWDVLDGARTDATLAEAVAGSTLVAASSGRDRAGAWTPRDLAGQAERLAGGGRLSLVFGPESSGLTEREIAACGIHVRVPADAEQPSLNLAQAVLILAYELRLAWLAGSGAAAPSGGTGPPAGEVAPAGEVDEAMRALRAALVGVGYLNRQNPDAVLDELRALVARASITRREVALLRGLARQVGWAAERLGEVGGPPRIG